MKLGVVGLPNVGKSTLFNAITKAGAQSANYPFCTIEPNVGIVDVYDPRLEVLGKIYNTKKITPAQIEFVDIAGLVKGASEGLGLGNKFLSHIKEVDAIVHVVRCFKDEKIIHVEGSVDPIRDIDTINIELILADIETVTKRLSRVEKLARQNTEHTIVREKELLEIILKRLSDQKPARSIDFNDEDQKIVDGFFLITSKPILYVANISDIPSKEQDEMVEKVTKIAEKEDAEIISLCARLEEELISLPDEERLEFMKELNMDTTGLDKLVVASYKLLGLISYLTAGEKEVRAWTIKRGTLAPQAAGKIHTDFEKGFIRAEIVKYADLVACGDFNMAKEKGKMISAGKDYEMKDGDVTLFKFNV